MNPIALIGPTASGKTELSLRLAKNLNACILSLDSLSVYQGIDIASAKPNLQDRQGIKHFGIDVVMPDSPFSVGRFFDLYQDAFAYARQSHQNLIVVGGTGFYLKSLIEGISPMPVIDHAGLEQLKAIMQDPIKAYEKLQSLDSTYASAIKAGDTYRLTKAWEIYYASGEIPSVYFAKNPKQTPCEGMEVYAIAMERQDIIDRIAKRTQEMCERGLVDEVRTLHATYGEALVPQKAIGIKEVLAYLRGELGFETMREAVIANTKKLAKRQNTFLRTQLQPQATLEASGLYEIIMRQHT